MNSFADSLRERLEKATGKGPPWGDVNPLVMIGLTEAILDLGLTEEQMYPAVRGFLRQLAAQVHPDRNPVNVSSSRQQQILDALNYLDDRENFSRALDHFRTLKAEDRREVKILSQTVDSLRRQSKELDKKEVTLRAEKESFVAMRDAFRKQQSKEPLQVPKLEETIQSLARGLDRSEKFAKEEQRLHQTWLRRYGQIQHYMLNLGSAPWPGPPFYPFAFDAKWVVVVTLSFRKFQYKDKAKTKTEEEERKDKQEKRTKLVHFWTPKNKNGKTREEFLASIDEAGVPEDRVEEIMESWDKAAKRLQRPDENKANVLALTIAVLKLSAGSSSLLFGDPQTAIGRVIGSMSPHEKSLTRKDFKPQSQIQIFEEMIPFLVPEKLLISASKKRRDNPQPPLETLHDRSFFYARREILAAG